MWRVEVLDNAVLIPYFHGLAVSVLLTLLGYGLVRWMGLFSQPSGRSALSPMPWEIVVVAFFVYLGAEMLLGPLLGLIILCRGLCEALQLGALLDRDPLSMGALQVASIGVAWLALMGLLYVLGKGIRHAVWNGAGHRGKEILRDVGWGVAAFLVGYPAVVAVSELVELATLLVTGVAPVDQEAVKFLKMAMAYPSLLGALVIGIVILVPMAEEILFRGLLQNWLRRYFSGRALWLVGAACFSLFHYSPTQGITNLSILAALFVLSCLLGFVYERQRSLWAPFALHAIFNATSTALVIWMQ